MGGALGDELLRGTAVQPTHDPRWVGVHGEVRRRWYGALGWLGLGMLLVWLPVRTTWGSPESWHRLGTALAGDLIVLGALVALRPPDGAGRSATVARWLAVGLATLALLVEVRGLAGTAEPSTLALIDPVLLLVVATAVHAAASMRALGADEPARRWQVAAVATGAAAMVWVGIDVAFLAVERIPDGATPAAPGFQLFGVPATGALAAITLVAALATLVVAATVVRAFVGTRRWLADPGTGTSAGADLAPRS